jgi:RNA-directed DNA polymerase
MAKGPSGLRNEELECQEPMVNTDDPISADELWEAEQRVLKIQTKLHQWASDDPGRQFADLFNLVADPAFLMVAWARVRGNRGARSAGVDRVLPTMLDPVERAFLTRLRQQVKTGEFAPMPVRERLIPKRGGKLRALGIPTAADRVVQASLKLVLEPIFEVDFQPCSYGFRPKRRAQDAIAEIHMLATNSYEWVLDADITACFDEISHPALLHRMRRRVGDKRVLGLVKAFLKAGVLSEQGVTRDTKTGTPQGGILSPLLANIALSVLDDHFAGIWQTTMATRVDRARRRRHGHATFRLVRYAGDFVVVVHGTRQHAEAVRAEVVPVLASVGLRLSEEKTTIASLDEGFEFLGFRIQRQTNGARTNDSSTPGSPRGR